MLRVSLVVLAATSSCCALVRAPDFSARSRFVRLSPPASVANPELIDLVEEKKIGALLERAAQEPGSILKLLKDAGVYGVFAYVLAYLIFYSTAAPIGEVIYHGLTGLWFDPRLLLDGNVEALALFGSFYLLCKPFAPLRLGGALLLTPDVKRFVKERPAITRALEATGNVIAPLWKPVAAAGAATGAALGAVVGAVYGRIAPRMALKDELFELASDGSDQARLDQLMLTELPALNPTADPGRSELLTGEWECRWTDFAVKNGLLGPWVKTYQTIDVGAGTLENVLTFEGGELRFGSSIAPDVVDGRRFLFELTSCSLTRRALTVPLPPVGRGYGELLYLDARLRIQRDDRGTGHQGCSVTCYCTVQSRLFTKHLTPAPPRRSAPPPRTRRGAVSPPPPRRAPSPPAAGRRGRRRAAPGPRRTGGSQA